MISATLEKQLKEIGLDYKKILVYTSLLELSEGLVSEIATKAKTERVSTYKILEQLLTKGLVSRSKRRGKQIYIANDPQLLANLAEQKLQVIQSALPELFSLYNQIGHKPKIQFFEGVDGLLSIYDDIIATCLLLPKSEREILEYISPDSGLQMIKDEQLRFIKKRIDYKIKLRWLAPDSQYAREFLTNAEKEYRELRLVDPSRFKLATEIDLYGDKMALFGSKEQPLGVIIEHKEMVATQKEIFELAWLGAKL